MKDSLLTVLEAVRAAQATLKNGRNSSVTVEQLRDILCGARVLGAVRALSHDEEGFPRVPQNQPLPRQETFGPTKKLFSASELRQCGKIISCSISAPTEILGLTS